MLPLFSEFEAITACRDRNALGHIILKAFSGLLGEKADVALFRRESGDTGLTICAGPTVMAAAFGPWEGLLQASQIPNVLKTEVKKGRLYGVIPLHSSEVSTAKMLIAFAAEENVATENLENL